VVSGRPALFDLLFIVSLLSPYYPPTFVAPQPLFLEFWIVSWSWFSAMFPGSCGVFLWEFWAALMEPVLTFPPLSPGWPGYDINDDAKMYMQAMVL
jgi:hypothetical protein